MGLAKLKMKRKAQSAIEFVILVGAMLFIFITFLFVFQQKTAERSYERRNFAIQELALNVQNELSIAACATDGYQREFEVPSKILGMEYDITLIANSVYINTTDGRHAMALPVQNVSGSIQKGGNFIRKENGEVLLN